MLEKFVTYQLALDFFKECEQIKVRGELKSQLHRASLSIVLNLSEGSAKITQKDKIRFYAIALGSYRECTSILHIKNELRLLKEYDKLGACLYRLCHPKTLAG